MYDAIVIGAGHAGSEAALALARLGKKTLVVTGNLNMIASMPCNPSIGGPAKGTLVREIDALGGEMGRNADRTALQMKMLNGSKGPAVRALRAQSDKVLYPQEMRKVLETEPGIELLEAYVRNLLVDNETVLGVRLEDGKEISSRIVVLTTGTYMNGAILVGDKKTPGGPDKQRPSLGLSDQLKALGIPTLRLKTGTPPRLKKASLDYSRMEMSPGDGFIHHFSFDPTYLRILDHEWPCYLIHTTKDTHRIIYDNLEKSSMYGGYVEGVGPRYCPSIEDKLVRFADKERHQLFIEPESQFLEEVYLQGFSTSMPHDIQDQMIRSLPGLENAVIAKYAYAIEYDAIDSTTLKPTLESKVIVNLYFAGQVNGTSGYEEAAAQGLMAGINASRKLDGADPFVLRRDEAYIGVLIDDLVTKGTREPYRMLTSRAEFRLLLRHDNADARLTEKGHGIGLVSESAYERYLDKMAKIGAEKERLAKIDIYPGEAVNKLFSKLGHPPLKGKTKLLDIFKRPEIGTKAMKELFPDEFTMSEEIYEQIEIDVKYEGYINKAIKETERFQKEEAILIPEDIDYDQVMNLANEARSKLKKIRPQSISQAARISGVNPADIQMLLIHLRLRKHPGSSS